jgi:YidC/Oxa1 family membrane protein insertase
MRTELRFLLAIGLMLLVLVGTNVLFPPVPPEPPVTELPDGTGPTVSTPSIGSAGDVVPPAVPPISDSLGDSLAAPGALTAPPPLTRAVRAVSPMYTYEFTTRGAALQSAQLLLFRSLRTEGPVELIPGGSPALSYRVVSGRDTIDLRSQLFAVTPEDGIALEPGGPPQALTFTYQNPSGSFVFEVRYTFHADRYVVEVDGRVAGAERPLVLTEMGKGLGFNEADSTGEARSMAYVGNHVNEGIQSSPLAKVEAERLEEGPFLWAAFRSKFFLMAVLPSDDVENGGYFGGLLVRPEGREQASVAVAQEVRGDGTFAYRLMLGPQNYGELAALGNDLEEVNPYGWRFFRPIVRPFVSIITTVLTFLHNSLGWGYGWVLILFGILMRIVLWPFNQKAMRAQMRNMAVQPLVKEIQTKYKDNPERMQKEMLRLYKEYGFNPMAGCLPMLLPWPILIALFFVFQNTIEFRGVPFLWLPDLSAPDPLYLLPIFLAISMFVLQYISYKSMDQDNPQMKMMLWFFPIFFGFLFMQFAAGLNLYYSVSNVATLPQQYWITKERKKAKGVAPLKLDDKK